jgi:hypothetical protein
VVHALEAHIATLKTELAGEKERADRAMVELRGDVDSLKGQLVTERERADRAIAEFVELARRLAAIAETQATADAEPPRRKLGRAWGWFLRN